MEIITFNENHVEPAAKLFSIFYKEAREKLSVLPQKYEDGKIILPLLQDIYKKSFGVVAVDNGQLVGYLIGLPVPNFKGTQRGIYCPEWAHVAIGENRVEVLKLMYERASSNWVENGCLTHAITLFANDNEAIDIWFRNGFGMHVVDGVRTLDILSEEVNCDVEIRKCNYDDVSSVVPLLVGLKRHFASSPTYIPLINIKNTKDTCEWLEKPNNSIWLGVYNGEIISVMKVIYKGSNDAQILSDDDTVSIGETFTREDFRGRGVTRAILQKVIEESSLQGYKRCAVVFESQNILASKFWLRYFQPAFYSLVRKIDDRITWANKDRNIETML